MEGEWVSSDAVIEIDTDNVNPNKHVIQLNENDVRINTKTYIYNILVLGDPNEDPYTPLPER